MLQSERILAVVHHVWHKSLFGICPSYNVSRMKPRFGGSIDPVLRKKCEGNTYLSGSDRMNPEVENTFT
jgi:hypothetical protein